MSAVGSRCVYIGLGRDCETKASVTREGKAAAASEHL